LSSTIVASPFAGEVGAGEGDDLASMQDRALKYKEGLETQLSEYEEENNKLSTEMAKLSKREQELMETNRKLALDNETMKHDNDTMSKSLAEKTEMLEKVKVFMQKNSKKGGGGSGGDDDDGDEEDGDAADPFEALGAELEQLTLEREELLAIVVEMEGEIADRTAQHATDQTYIHECKDEIEALETRLAELMENAANDDVLKEMLHEGEEQRKRLQSDKDAMQEARDKLQAERDALQSELNAIRAQLDGAAAGGLSLLEMLNKLKAEHAAAVEKLNTRVTELETELAQHKARLEQLLEFLPQGEEGEGADAGDAIEQLATRLKRALADKLALEGMLAETEEREASALKQIDELNATVDKLRATLSALQEAKAALEAELEAFRAGVGKAKAAAKAIARRNREYDEEEEEPAEGDNNEDALQQLLDALDETEAKLAAAEAELVATLEEVAFLRDALATTEADLNDLRDELAAAAALKVSTAEEHAKKVAKLNKVIEALRKELDLKEKVIADLKSQIVRLEQMLSKEKTHGKEGDKKIAILEAELAHAQHQMELLQKKMRAALNWIKGRELREWIKNDAVEECPLCESEFTMMRRRHHCRICGGVFCAACTSHRHQGTASKKAVRACTDCKNFLTDLTDGKMDDADGSPTLERKLFRTISGPSDATHDAIIRSPSQAGTPSKQFAADADSPKAEVVVGGALAFRKSAQEKSAARRASAAAAKMDSESGRSTPTKSGVFPPANEAAPSSASWTQRQWVQGFRAARNREALSVLGNQMRTLADSTEKSKDLNIPQLRLEYKASLDKLPASRAASPNTAPPPPAQPKSLAPSPKSGSSKPSNKKVTDVDAFADTVKGKASPGKAIEIDATGVDVQVRTTADAGNTNTAATNPRFAPTAPSITGPGDWRTGAAGAADGGAAGDGAGAAAAAAADGAAAGDGGGAAAAGGGDERNQAGKVPRPRSVGGLPAPTRPVRPSPTHLP
jgi:hypothetical protein